MTMSSVQGRAATAPVVVARRMFSPVPGQAAKATSDCSGEMGMWEDHRMFVVYCAFTLC